MRWSRWLTVAVTTATALVGCGVDRTARDSSCAAAPPGPVTAIASGTLPAVDASYRGDAGLSGSFSTSPVRQLHGEIWRSPSMSRPGRTFAAAGAVLLVSDTAGLCAVDVATGRLRWYKGGRDLVGTPSVEGGTAFVSGSSLTVTALDLGSGRVRWRRPIRHPALPGFSTFAVASAGTVFVTAPDGVTALDARSGHLRWHVAVGNPSSGLAIGERLVMVVDGQGVLHALDAGSGVARWARPVGTSAELPLVAGGTILVGRGSLLALDAQSGRVKWTAAIQQQVTGAALGGGVAYLETAKSHVLAVDAATGALRWDFVPSVRAGFTTGPSLAGDVVYAGDRQGTVYAINTSTHQQLWTYEADLRPGERKPGGRIAPTRRREFAGAPLVISDGVVIVSDVSGTLYALK